MIYVIGNLVLFCALWFIIFYTNKIFHVQNEDTSQLFQIFKGYSELYKAFKSTRLDPNAFFIPGLFKTQTLEKETKRVEDCYDMAPQGLAVTQDYLFISAYCHSHIHHSVIFMLDKKENQYIKTILLKDRTHAGGLAYDENQQCLWFSAFARGHGRVAAITMEDILNYELTAQSKPINYACTVDFPSLYQASFITLAEESLLAGTFVKNGKGAVAKASLVENEDSVIYSVENTKVIIPKKIQGLVFYKDYCLLSQSFGPVNSKIYIYSKEQFNAGRLDKKSALKVIKAPPYLEQIAVDDDYLYALFESGATSYREKTAKFLMEVLAFHLPTLIETGKKL